MRVLWYKASKQTERFCAGRGGRLIFRHPEALCRVGPGCSSVVVWSGTKRTHRTVPLCLLKKESSFCAPEDEWNR